MGEILDCTSRCLAGLVYLGPSWARVIPLLSKSVCHRIVCSFSRKTMPAKCSLSRGWKGNLLCVPSVWWWGHQPGWGFGLERHTLAAPNGT